MAHEFTDAIMLLIAFTVLPAPTGPTWKMFGPLGAGLDEILHRLGIHVEDGHRERRLQHVVRHRVAHVSDTDESDGHRHWSLLTCSSALRQRVLTILSHISAYCCRYGGQIFSSAILRNEATSAWFTFMPFGSRISLAFWKLSTDSVSSRIFAWASRPTSLTSFCCSGVSPRQMSRFIVRTVGP